jgi:hypothetical protein
VPLFPIYSYIPPYLISSIPTGEEGQYTTIQTMQTIQTIRGVSATSTILISTTRQALTRSSFSPVCPLVALVGSQAFVGLQSSQHSRPPSDGWNIKPSLFFPYYIVPRIRTYVNTYTHTHIQDTSLSYAATPQQPPPNLSIIGYPSTHRHTYTDRSLPCCYIQYCLRPGTQCHRFPSSVHGPGKGRIFNLRE